MNKRLVNIIFGISLSVLILLSVLTFDRLSTFKNYTNIVDNSNQILLSISNLKSGFNTAIAEQRSYLITKDTTYYNNFQYEKSALRQTLQQFKKLSRGNKVHESYAKKLEETADNRIQSLLVEIINDTATTKYKYVQNDLIKSNEEINMTYYELLETINKHERQLLRRRLRMKEFQEELTPFLLFILSLAILGIISYSFVLISRELKEREKATELLKENIENLNRSNKDLEQYAYVASHDLQEPLRKIRMFGDKLIKDYGDKLDEEALNMLERMDASSERMTNLINDLLSLSKLNDEQPKLEEVKLNEVVSEVLISLEDKIENIEIDIGELPVISAVKGQMFQLFQNIIGNALKFRKQRNDSYIRIRAYEKTMYEGDSAFEYTHIVIKDNGQGFDPQYKEKMFTIFGRLEKTADINGTGIGLSICSRIMQNHGGMIDAEGKINGGAEFHLYFPK